MPFNRWDVDNSKALSIKVLEPRFGAFASLLDMFDPHFFGLSLSETLYLDPQQRFLLVHAYEVFQSLPSNCDFERNIGVMIGVSQSEFINLSIAYLPFSGFFATGSSTSVASGRCDAWPNLLKAWFHVLT